MNMKIIRARNAAIGFIYRNLLRRVFFLFDAEKVHDFFTAVGMLLGSNVVTKFLTGIFFNYSHKSLEQEILGIKFRNPVGLAAGFDKDARLTGIMPAVGFGFNEIGSVTGEPCSGNEKPRLWRLIKSKSLIVNYGLKNQGAEKIAARLKNKISGIPLGISVAKTNNPATADTEAGIADYLKAYKLLSGIGDYTAINISCPNTFGGEPFTDPDKLERLLTRIDRAKSDKPIFLKLPPDTKLSELDKIIAVSQKHRVSGFICSNLTKDRNNEKIKSKILDSNAPGKGGLSGKIAEELADEQIRYVHQKTSGKYVIIGCGGIFSAEDAYKKIKAGASLVQMITGMIFEGPQIISEINRGLVELLKKDGYKNISEAIGAGNIPQIS